MIGVFIIVRNTSAEHDRLQVQLLAQLLPVLVHTAGQPEAPVVRMDEHLYTI